MTLTYETKCRRCNKINEWAFGNAHIYDPVKEWEKLHTYMYEVMNGPTVCRCDCNGATTIQDYVSYSEKPQKEEA